MPCQSKQQSAYSSKALPDSVSAQLQNAKDLAVNRLLRPNSVSNIVGVGMGRKVVDNEVTDTRCVRIYVQSKHSPNDLSPAEVVPPAFLDIPTDIIEVGRLGRKGNLDNYLRDDQQDAGTGPGSSIRVKTTSSNVNQGAAGTLGAILEDGKARYILSCNHVLTVNGRVLNSKDTSIVTPALSHNSEAIARPNEFFIGLARDQKNCVDCAMAPMLEMKSKEVKPHFRAAKLATGTRGGGQGAAATESPIGVPDRGQKVRKDGATTGLTSGTVVDVNADFYVEYSFGTFLFSNQVVIQGDNDAFAANGDSGSIVIDTGQNKAIAMVFAECGKFAIACSLTDVIQQLKEKANAPNLTLVSY
jgi:hypothetical protein